MTTNKKTRAKLQPHNSQNRRGLSAYLRFSIPLFALLFVQLSCALAPEKHQTKILYSTPPEVGSWLRAQRELVACDTVAAARYMANFGFFHPQCHQLEHIGPEDYRVLERTKVQLREGPMWLLTVQRQQSMFWVPIPWHDWL